MMKTGLKRLCCAALALLLSIALPASAALAVDHSRSYLFDLEANGENEITVEPGDVVTVTLRMKRTDSGEASVIYGMQDEIRYDDTFLQIVPDETETAPNIATNDIGLIGGQRAFYMNYVSLGGGSQWDADTLIGTFRVKIIGENGSAVLKNENCSVSVQDGSDSFAWEVKDLYINIAGYYTVTFDAMNGNKTWDISVPSGAKIDCPEAPTFSGNEFIGWFSDKDLQDQWDFDTDPVNGNLTLYAGWRSALQDGETEPSDGGPAASTRGTGTDDGREKTGLRPIVIACAAAVALVLLLLLLVGSRPVVRFDGNNGTPVLRVRAKKNALLKRPADPAGEGRSFVGWYKDEALTELWSFESDKVERSMTLFGKWR